MNTPLDMMLELPTFDKPTQEIPSDRIDFTTVIRETEQVTRFYLRHYDSPELRFKSKNPQPFVL